jgi:hypothetical protein
VCEFVRVLSILLDCGFVIFVQGVCNDEFLRVKTLFDFYNFNL